VEEGGQAWVMSDGDLRNLRAAFCKHSANGSSLITQFFAGVASLVATVIENRIMEKVAMQEWMNSLPTRPVSCGSADHGVESHTTMSLV
jgi:hypothetical protein